MQYFGEMKHVVVFGRRIKSRRTEKVSSKILMTNNRNTRRHTQENLTLHNHSCENYKLLKLQNLQHKATFLEPRVWAIWWISSASCSNSEDVKLSSITVKSEICRRILPKCSSIKQGNSLLLFWKLILSTNRRMDKMCGIGAQNGCNRV